MNLSDISRPAIVVIADPASAPAWRQLLLGMEEEGIPYVIQQGGDARSPLNEQAYSAAAASPLAVGIAVDGRQVMVHEPHLPVGRPLFVLAGYAALPADTLRRLGCNAARLVKGLPFK